MATVNNIGYSTEDIVRFAQKIIQTPSESGQEMAVANIIADEMRRLDFDDVMVDSIGNVVGWIRGSGGGQSLMLNGHIDHAEPGTMEDPFSAKIISGEKYGEKGEAIYGRAAVDMKGAIACMVYAAANIKAKGIAHRGDIIVAGNPMEETSGADGVLHMLNVDKITADASVCGEATNLRVYLGHRGNAEVTITVHGKMAHGSNPSNGINAATNAARLACYIMDHYPERLPKNKLLGDCTTTVLDIKADTARKAPVVPDRCFLYIDRRFLPGETKEQILNEFRQMVDEAAQEIPNLKVDLEITKWGVAMFTPEEADVTQSLIRARTQVMGEKGEISAWIFGTDGAFVAEHGIPTIGFGPGDEQYAHTPDDHIPIEHLVLATKVYEEMAVDFCK